MTPFPPIQHVCPWLDRLDTVVKDGFCSMCRREVHDLTAMDDKARADFLVASGGDACITYTSHVKPVLAAALIAASAAVLATPAVASSRHHVPHPPHAVPPLRTVPVVTGGVPMPPPPEPPNPPPTGKPAQNPD